MTDPKTDPMTASGSELSAMTAAELVAGYRSGVFTPLDATRSVLDTIEERDGSVNAFVRVDPDGALAQASESTERWRSGRPRGIADGVPISVKDILWTAGLPTIRGTWLIDEAGPWPEDAPAVARLREAGAVITGKTTTPEFAWKGVTDSLRYGSTGNPWDPGLTSGGSSGGAAAAVGLGMGPWALGTDGGGSVRIPASFTGTVTIKPTYGLIPLYPASPFGTLSHAGPMTRTVTDTAALLDVVAGFDSRDWSAMPTPRASFLAGLDDGVDGLRIGFSPTLGYVENDPEVERLVRAAVAVLESVGAHVEEVDPGFTDPVEAFDVLWFCGAAKVLDAYPPGSIDKIDALLREGIETKGRGSAADYLGATAVRMDLGRLMGRFHETYDLLVTPTMPITAFERGLQAPEGWPSQWWPSWTPYTYPFNMTQQPAASVPCGTTEAGLPVGLQIVGARHDDARVLRAARAYERASGELFVRPVDHPRGAR